jgi:hypothetical protein
MPLLVPVINTDVIRSSLRIVSTDFIAVTFVQFAWLA